MIRCKVASSSFCKCWSLLILLTIIVLLLSGCGQEDYSTQIEKHKRLAGELNNNSLHQAAIEEYGRVLDYDDIDDRVRANICYLIGRTYFEDIKDYRQAAAYYIRARGYDPAGTFVTEASRNLVASLEKLGNVLDARRQLGAAADLAHQPVSDDDVIVARIGARDIWLSEVEDQIALLPPELQTQLVSRGAKLQYVHQYVGVELLYNAAIRENYLADPEVQSQKEQLVKRILVDRFVTEKIMSGVVIDAVDVQNYYAANKDSLYSGAPFDSVRTRAYRDYQSYKAEAAYADYIMRLAEAEKAEFLDHNIK